MKRLFGLILAAALLVPVFTGCKTPQSDGTQVYDEKKTEELKAALQPLVSSLARRGLLAKPEARLYVKLMAEALENMRDSKSFDPGVLNGSLDQALSALPKDKEWAGYVIDTKNTLYALYTIFWKERTTVLMGEEKWGYHLTDFLATALRSALADSAN